MIAGSRLPSHFKPFSELFGDEGVKLAFTALDRIAFNNGALQIEDDANNKGAGVLAQSLRQYFLDRKVFAPGSPEIKRLEQVTGLFDGGEVKCTGDSCRTTVRWVSPDESSTHRDWEVERQLSTKQVVGCRAMTKNGWFRKSYDLRGNELDRYPQPFLAVEATSTAWLTQAVNYYPGSKLRPTASPGERINYFIVGGREFKATVTNIESERGILSVPSASPDFGALLEALRDGHNITVVYRSEGARLASYEHLSLHGFLSAYQAMVAGCRGMTSLIPVRTTAADPVAVPAKTTTRPPAKGAK